MNRTENSEEGFQDNLEGATGGSQSDSEDTVTPEGTQSGGVGEKAIYAKNTVTDKLSDVQEKNKGIQQKLLIAENAEKQMNQGWLNVYDEEGKCILCRTGDYHFLFSIDDVDWGIRKSCEGYREKAYQPVDDYRDARFREMRHVLGGTTPRSSNWNTD